MSSVQAAADPDRFQLLTKSSANIINLLRVRIGTWTTSISFLFFLERERGHGRGGGTKRKRENGGGQNRPNLSGPSSFAKWEPIRFCELILRR